MDEATARRQLEQLVAADQDPTLTLPEVDALLERARIADLAGNSPRNVEAITSLWAASTVVLAGTVVRTTDGRYFRAQVPGTTGSTEPTWPALPLARRRSLAEVYDGTVIWEDFGTEWSPTFDLEAAAARGWRMKAGKAAGRFDFGEDGQQFSRSQVVAHCHAMADSFSSTTATTVNV